MKKFVHILIHAFLWLLLYFTFWYLMRFMPMLSKHPDYSPFKDPVLFAWTAMIIISLAVPFYLGYFLTPYIFYHKRRRLFILFTVIFGIIYPIAGSIWDDGLVPGIWLQTLWLFAFYNSFLILGISFRSLFSFIEQKRIREELERQNLKSELALLRSQLNPHFLFNTLHNIDTLISGDPGKASQSLIRLSDMMRYMLRESQMELVPLEKELAHIRNYLALEEIRLTNKDFLDFSLTGDPGSLEIPPMLFFPFIENAFKHSVRPIKEKGIIIRLNIEQNQLTFISENLYDTNTMDKDATAGIGLDIIRKRLILLYPGRHHLSIEQDEQKYKVKLELILYEDQVHRN